jgi:uncharacterized protein (TIGR02145 family)
MTPATRIPTLLFFLILFLFACKKDPNPGSANIKQDVAAFHQLKNKIAAHFIETKPASADDEAAHSEQMEAWIKAQPGVRSVRMPDIYVFDITHDNGLSGNMLFVSRQTDPKKKTRGGNGSKGAMRVFNTLTDDEKLIENKNVLIVVAYATEFYAPDCDDCKHLSTLIDIFESSPIDFKVTVKVNEGIESFSQLDDYGIIIFSTHGTPTGVITGQHYIEDRLIAFSDDIVVADETEDMAARLRDGHIKLTSIWEYSNNKELQLKDASFELTFDYFKSLPVSFDNSVLIGNYCYSGIENGKMAAGLEPKGLKSFYGFGYDNGKSAAVTNELAWRAEDTIVTNLIKEYDTTGIAHLANNTTRLQDDVAWQDYSKGRKKTLAEKYNITGPQQLLQYLDKGYHFPKCGDSLTDKRDGRKYPTVCIGEQVWMGKNLNWAGAGICYDNRLESCSAYGRLYTIAEVTGGANSPANPSGIRGVCPEGWHVPSRAEWDQLVEFVGGEQKANTMLRATTGWPRPNSNTDAYKMALLPGGLAINGNDGIVFQNQGLGGYYWTTTASNSMYYGINTYPPQVTSFAYGPASTLNWQFSCRCVKDKK